MKFKFSSLEPNFLHPLSHLARAPDGLWFIGQLPEVESGTSKVVSIVGSRKNTPYGAAVAYQLSYELAQRGFIIVSGLAYGIDSCAHQGCIDAGGITVAVLGTAIDQIYPRPNYALAQKILEHGAILSEYSPGTETGAWSFLERNRIVAGLSAATVIVEAATRSGTLATANFALEQGKELFAVPGDITRPMSTGCNRLIKHGAHAFTEINDLLETVDPKSCRPTKHYSNVGDNPQEAAILQLISRGVQDGDDIILAAKLTAAEFSQHITMLEIKGRVRSLGANKWCII